MSLLQAHAMLAKSSQLTSGVWLSWFLIMSFYYFISLFSMQKKFEDLLRNKNITTEIRAQASENNFPLLFSDRTCCLCCWNNRVIWHHAFYSSRRLSSLFDNGPRYPLSHFVYFYYYFLIQYLSRGIQFSRASLQWSPDTTQKQRH